MSRPQHERTQIVVWAVPLMVALATFVVFLPAVHSGFVTWDDDRNFLDNPHYRGLGVTQLRWMWTTFHMGHYVPLSWMTLGLDYTLWGMNPAGYHVVNLVLHAANAVLLYVIARRILRLTGVIPAQSTDAALAIPAAVAALLFAVHPLRVESVAWITERRDMLSLLFYLTSVLFYLRYVDERGNRAGQCGRGGRRTRHSYWLALGAFACALLSKGTAVTLPAVLLILNVYPLERLAGQTGWWSDAARRVYVELIPFAVLSAALSALTLVALHPPSQLEPGGKLAVSAYSLSFYVWKTIAPLNLSPLYEMPKRLHPLAAKFLLSYAVAIGLTVFAWSVRRRWPGVTAAWFVFLAVILPMLGVVQNGPQIAADRYAYHAAPALAILGGAGFSLLVRRFAAPTYTIAAAVLIGFGVLSWNQTRVWHDSESLWTNVLRHDSGSSIAHVALGSLFSKQGRLEEAIEHYERGIAIDTGYAEGYNNLGVALARQGRFAEAVERYRQALAFKPTYSDAHNNWGIALAQQGDLVGALEHYRQALAIKPDYADAHVNWGNALVRLDQLDDAIAHYRAAIAIQPDNADAEFNWGVALARQRKFAEAIAHFQQALAFDPQHASAKEYLALATQLLQRQQTNGRSP